MKAKNNKNPLLYVLVFVGLLTAILKNHEVISNTVVDIVLFSGLIAVILQKMVFHRFRKES